MTTGLRVGVEGAAAAACGTWYVLTLLQAKRSKGAPKAPKPGTSVLVSIVVTDVKDFSDLTRRFPELMNKAMGGHNNILRKACHAHAGHVMDQEVCDWGLLAWRRVGLLGRGHAGRSSRRYHSATVCCVTEDGVCLSVLSCWCAPAATPAAG